MVWIILGILLLFLLYAAVQGVRTSRGLTKAYNRLIAPSRFGYLGSDIK
jgi:hypothetical protein